MKKLLLASMALAAIPSPTSAGQIPPEFYHWNDQAYGCSGIDGISEGAAGLFIHPSDGKVFWREGDLTTGKSYWTQVIDTEKHNDTDGLIINWPGGSFSTKSMYLSVFRTGSKGGTFKCMNMNTPVVDLDHAIHSTDWSKYPKDLEEPALDQMPQENFVCKKEDGLMTYHSSTTQTNYTGALDKDWHVSIQPSNRTVLFKDGTKARPIKDYWIMKKDNGWRIDVLEFDVGNITRVVDSEDIIIGWVGGYAKCGKV